jgi:hypothetical protein
MSGARVRQVRDLHVETSSQAASFRKPRMQNAPLETLPSQPLADLRSTNLHRRAGRAGAATAPSERDRRQQLNRHLKPISNFTVHTRGCRIVQPMENSVWWRRGVSPQGDDLGYPFYLPKADSDL